MARKRVLHIIDHLGIGGAQRGVLDIIQNQEEPGFHRLAVLRTDENEMSVDVPDVFQFQARSAFDQRAFLWLLRKFREQQPSILHAHLFRAQVYSWALALVAGFRGPLVFHERGNIYEVSAAQKTLIRLMAPRVDRVICVSEATKRKLAECVPVLAAKTQVIYNGIDVDAIRARILNESQRAQLRANLGISAGVTVLGFFGRLEWQKGIDELISGLPEWPDSSKLLIVGRGSEESKHKAHVQSLGLENRVLFLGFRADAIELMSICDLIVVPSRYEPFPRVVLEAFCAGTPVLAAAVDGIPELIEDGVTGWLYEGGGQELAASLVRVLAGPERLANVSQTAARHVQKYHVNRQLHELDETYQELLARREKP